MRRHVENANRDTHHGQYFFSSEVFVNSMTIAIFLEPVHIDLSSWLRSVSACFNIWKMSVKRRFVYT